MVEGLAPFSGGLDENLEIVLDFFLADVFVEGLGTEGDFDLLFVLVQLGCQEMIRHP
jgi:hypothetical protein